MEYDDDVHQDLMIATAMADDASGEVSVGGFYLQESPGTTTCLRTGVPVQLFVR